MDEPPNPGLVGLSNSVYHIINTPTTKLGPAFPVRWHTRGRSSPSAAVRGLFFTFRHAGIARTCKKKAAPSPGAAPQNLRKVSFDQLTLPFLLAFVQSRRRPRACAEQLSAI